jgi:hypothetical protein
MRQEMHVEARDPRKKHGKQATAENQFALAA